MGYWIHKAEGDDAWRVLRAVFANGADELNLLMLSTSGIHGSYLSLDDLDSAEYRAAKEPDDTDEITFLIVHPRTVGLVYGNVTITNNEQREWLRARVAESIAAIGEAQKGNLPKPTTG